MTDSKGITPILAFLVLIFIALSVSGSLYTLVSTGSLGGEKSGGAGLGNTDLTILSVSSDEDHLILHLRNTGKETINISEFSLKFKDSREGSAVGYEEFEKSRPNLVRKGFVYTFDQNGKSYFIRPYMDNVSGSDWYPDTNKKLADSPIENAVDSFAVTVYRQKGVSKEYLVFSNQNSNKAGRAKINLEDIPEGSSVVHSDGLNGEGPVPHNHDELSFSHEPEGNWGWITSPGCCYDGGVVRLGSDWENITVDPVSIGPNLKLYEQYDGSFDVNDSSEIVVNKFEGNQCFRSDAESLLLEPGQEYSCFTGINMPKQEDLILVVDMIGTSKKWSYRCSPTDRPLC